MILNAFKIYQMFNTSNITNPDVQGLNWNLNAGTTLLFYVHQQSRNATI